MYILSVVLIVAGLFSIAYSIWKIVRKIRSESSEENHDDPGLGFLGSLSFHLADGICLLAGGIAVLIKFG